MISRVPRLTTTSASIAETLGTATTANSLSFGDFRYLFIGIRDEVQIVVLKERYADHGQVGFLVWVRADVQLAHEARVQPSERHYPSGLSTRYGAQA
jgi:HK97 family phage major capsid protein